MKWYLKALVQNAIALLPEAISQPLYYQLQRNIGELRHPRFDMRFEEAAVIARLLAEHHDGLGDKRVLEVGTGTRQASTSAMPNCARRPQHRSSRATWTGSYA